MPPLPAVPKVTRWDFKQKLGADIDILNHLFLQYSGALSQADLNTWVLAANGDWAAHIGNAQTTAITLEEVNVTDLSSATSPVAHTFPNTPGGSGSPPLPAGSAFVVRFHILRRYRGGHPRFYLGGVQNDELADPQTWNGTFATGVVTDLEATISAIIGHAPAAVGTVTHVSVSYFAGFTNVTFPSGRTHPVPTRRAMPLIDPILSYSANPKVASQRRRNLQSA